MIMSSTVSGTRTSKAKRKDDESLHLIDEMLLQVSRAVFSAARLGLGSGKHPIFTYAHSSGMEVRMPFK
jgi:hypothetical protein